jgi:hypothetical protein
MCVVVMDDLKLKNYHTKKAEGKNQKLKGKAPPKKKEDKDKVVPTTQPRQPRRSTRKKKPKK